MKPIKDYTIILLLCLFVIAALCSCHSTEQKFYDGEGNEVAIKDIRLLIKASYTIVSDSEYNRLDSVFYSTKHNPVK